MNFLSLILYFTLILSADNSQSQEPCRNIKKMQKVQLKFEDCSQISTGITWNKAKVEKIGRVDSLHGSQVIFQENLFSDGEFTNTILSSVSFVRSELKNISFTSSQLNYLTLSLAKTSQLKIENSTVYGFRCVRSQLRNASFRKSLLSDAVFEHCPLQGTDFRGADLRKVTFILSPLNEAIFDHKTQLPFSKDRALKLGMKEVQ